MKRIGLVILLNLRVCLSHAQNEVRTDSVSILFDYNRFEVLDEAALQSQLNGIDLSKVAHIRLVGYTDSIGTQTRNTILAAARISAVKRVLQKTGLHSLKIEILNANETSGFRAVPDELNRRVDILLYGKPEIKEAPKLAFELNKPLNLNINFVGGRADFLPESQANLEQLRNIMLEDTTLLLKLHGHVCCADDMPLSEKRAYAVLSYLIESGVDHKRMTAAGFSNRKQLVPEISEVNKSLNRRVEAIFYRKE